MELRHLRYFVAVAEEQNITRAAARLNVSQPPLSRQIRDLEEELGTPLLERTPRAVRLTPAGWAFLEECYPVLRQVEKATSAAQEAARGGRGELKLGYAPGPTQAMLREILGRLRQAGGGIRVALHDLTTAEMVKAVGAGKLHAALAVEPSATDLKGLTFEKLREDPMLAVLAPDHRLAKRRAIRLTELLAEPLVIFSRAEYPEHYEGLEELAQRGRQKLRIAMECDSGASLFAAIETGQGCSILSTALRPTIDGRLAMVPLEPAPPPHVVGIMYAPKSKSALLDRLLAIAREVGMAAVGKRKT